MKEAKMQKSNKTEGSERSSSVREIIDSGPLTPGILMIAGVCFLLNVLDGYDIVSMSAGATLIQSEWGLSSIEKGYILTAALLGMAMGASFLAPWCDKFGRRPMILGALICTSSCLIVSSLIQESLQQMIGVRLVTGLGIGVIMASTTAITIEYTPEKWKNFIVPIVVSGYPLGALCVGPIAQLVLPLYGWQMMFLGGGVLGFMFVPVVYFFLPESLNFMEVQKQNHVEWLRRINKSLSFVRREKIDQMPLEKISFEVRGGSAIFGKQYFMKTVVLVTCFFAAYLTIYFLLTWIPSLYESVGYSRSQGINALTLLNFGGVIGIFAIAVITLHLNLSVTLGIGFFLAAGLLVSFSAVQPDNLFSLNLMIWAIGVALYGAFTGMYTVVSRAYGVTERATGIGFSLGIGRLGAVASPILAGFLVDAGWTMYALFVVFSIPALVVSFFMFLQKC
ncbi:MFS transporter [Hirschia litorea]|uniref:MFS transporter n=1 Tax=Hirschia litorea TaxID=1199156 RepID=A0ABW2IKG3_9PROT